MATSIDQSVNWRDGIKAPAYQVAARQVDTFVQPESNSRASQVAKALGQAAGGLMDASNRRAREEKAAQAQASEQVSLLEAMNASNEGARWSPVIEEFTKTYDFSLQNGVRPDRGQVWEDFNLANPEYAGTLSNFQTLKGTTAFGDVTGDIFNKTFSLTGIARERLDEESALSTNIITKLAALPNEGLTQSFAELARQMDRDIMSFGRDPKEAYSTLANVANITAKESGDFRMYDYLLSQNIGGLEEKKKWTAERLTIKNQQAQQRNQRNTEVADKLKADKVLLAQEGAALFNTDAPVTSEQEIALIQKYIEQGVPNADSLVKTMSGNYRAIQKVVMTPEQESNIWQGFIAAGTPDNQRNFIQAQVNKKEISQGLATQLYSRLGNSNDKFLLQDVVYQQYFKGVETLSKKSTGFMGALENSIDYAYIRPLFQKKYLEMATAPDWKDKDPDAELANLFNSMRQLREINQSDFLSDGKTVNNQNDAQQLSELMNPETPEDVAERAARTAELLARIEARRKEAQATQ